MKVFKLILGLTILATIATSCYVDDVPQNNYLKYLTLDYDYLGNEYFELNVINHNTITLFHEASGAVYTFSGLGYIRNKNRRGNV